MAAPQDLAGAAIRSSMDIHCLLGRRIPQLKAERRAKFKPQIIVGSVTEVNFVAPLNADADRAGKSFNSSTRINSKVITAITYARHSAAKCRSRCDSGSICGEVDEPHLPRGEEAERATASDLELWAEQSSNGSDA